MEILNNYNEHFHMVKKLNIEKKMAKYTVLQDVGCIRNYRVFRSALTYFGGLDCQQGLPFWLKMGHVHVL